MEAKRYPTYFLARIWHQGFRCSSRLTSRLLSFVFFFGVSNTGGGRTSRSADKTRLQVELERAGKLSPDEQGELQSAIWSRSLNKTDALLQLERFEYEGDEFYPKPAAGWKSLGAGGVKAMLNRMYGFPFPAKGVGTMEGAKFTINQWWASNGNFETSRASTANATWARLNNLRPLVDPVTGDVTGAERSARQESQALHRESADRQRESADRANPSTLENANAATQAAALRSEVNSVLRESGSRAAREETEARARGTERETAARTDLLTDTPSSPALHEQWRADAIARLRNPNNNAPSSV